MTILNEDKKIKLINSVLSMFQMAKTDADVTAARMPVPELDNIFLTIEQQEALRKYQENLPALPKTRLAVIPQACAFLLSTDQIVGGVASNPITFTNPDAENAIGIAHRRLQNFHGLTSEFKIVAIALTTIPDQTLDFIELFEQTLSELPNLKARNLILVDPLTQNVAHSLPFSDYKITR